MYIIEVLSKDKKKYRTIASDNYFFSREKLKHIALNIITGHFLKTKKSNKQNFKQSCGTFHFCIKMCLF